MSKTIPLKDIDVSDRLRDIDEDHAQAIAQSIRGMGMEQPEEPIKVRRTHAGRKPWTLVDGGHRMRAVELLGGKEIIYAEKKLNKDQARLSEIDSNLMRAELTALDRALFLAERKRIYEKLHPETKQGGDRKSEAAKNQNDTDVVLKFTDDVAERLDLSPRSIERSVMIANRLPREAVKALRGTPEANNLTRLLKLARLEPDQRAMALNLFREDVPLADAMVQATGGKPKPKPFVEQKFEALVLAWKQAPFASQKKFLALMKSEIAEVQANMENE